MTAAQAGPASLGERARALLAESAGRSPEDLNDEAVALIAGIDRLEEELASTRSELEAARTAGEGDAKVARRDREEALEAQLLRAQKMEALGRLAAGVAHDFNNLLTVVAGSADVLMSSLRKDDPLREAAAEIQSATERGTNLTNKLLMFSRKDPSERQPLEVNELLRRMQGLLTRLIGEDVELRANLAERPCAIVANAAQIEQVVINLAINARDAMPKGGTLEFATSRVTLEAQETSLHPGMTPGSYVQVTVADSGTGMDAETMAHIFEPFFTTKPSGVGTGLGLPLVFSVVERGGGCVEVASELGKGTRFRLLFPESPAPAAASSSVERGSLWPAPAVVTGQTILVVEDEAPLRTMVVRVLRKLGYQTLQAAGGRAALELVERHEGTIDLLLTDVIMPGMGGMELGNAMRVRLPGIKVVYMSGYADEAIRWEGADQGKIRLLAKPFAPQALSRMLREALEEE